MIRNKLQMKDKKSLSLVLILCLINFVIKGQGAGDFVKYEKSGSTLLIHGTLGDLKIDAFTSDIFKVQVIKPNQTTFDSSYTVVLKPSGLMNNVVEGSSTLEAVFEKCGLVINKSPLKLALKANNQIKIEENVGITQSSDSVHLSFTINPKDVFQGGGSNPTYWDGKYIYDNLNKRLLHFYEGDMITGPPYPFFAPKFTIPYIAANQQYGLLIDSNLPNYVQMDLGFTDSTKIYIESPSNGKWAYYLINGDSNDEIIANYTLLTGRQALPPRWAFGFIQARGGYVNWQDAASIVNFYHNRNFPIEAMEIDNWYGDLSKIGNMNWDQTNWKETPQMISKLNAAGVKTILSLEPYLSTSSDNFNIAKNLCGFYPIKEVYTFNHSNYQNNYAVFDPFNPSYQGWVGNNLKTLMNQGVTTWRINETLTFIPDTESLNFIGGNMKQIRNLYNLTFQKVLFNEVQNDFPQNRQLIFSTSGWAGSQRYGMAIDCGTDIVSSLNASMAGVAYSHPAIQSSDNEMEIRQLQMATFSPILRSQSDNDLYLLSADYINIARNYVNLRYQLFPYIYTLAWQNTTTGRPFILSLDYFSKNDNPPLTYLEYFFGEQLLVAPVDIPGMFQRQIYFPTGKWFDFWNEKEAVVGGVIPFPFVPLTLNNIPVYAKAGSIIPMASSTFLTTDKYKSDSLIIKFFQDVTVSSNTFTMYHDDGKDPNTLANLRYELIDFVGKTNTDSLSFLVTQRKTFSGNLTNRIIETEFENFTSNPKSVSINNQNIPIVYNSAGYLGNNIAYYNLVEKQLKVRFNWNCSTSTKVLVQRNGLEVVTGIEAEKNILNVYPNPIFKNNKVNIEAAIKQTGHYEIEIINTLGKSVFHAQLGYLSKDQTLNFTWNPENQSGAFIVKLELAKNKFWTKKVIIE